MRVVVVRAGGDPSSAGSTANQAEKNHRMNVKGNSFNGRGNGRYFLSLSTPIAIDLQNTFDFLKEISVPNFMHSFIK